MMTKWDTIQADVADAYAYLDEEEAEQPPVDDFDDFSDDELEKALTLDWND